MQDQEMYFLNYFMLLRKFKQVDSNVFEHFHSISKSLQLWSLILLWALTKLVILQD